MEEREEKVNMERNYFETDAKILNIKNKVKTYEDFYESCLGIIIISDEEVFKKVYWENDFSQNFIRTAWSSFTDLEKFREYLKIELEIDMTKDELKEMLRIEK